MPSSLPSPNLKTLRLNQPLRCDIQQLNLRFPPLVHRVQITINRSGDRLGSGAVQNGGGDAMLLDQCRDLVLD